MRTALYTLLARESAENSTARDRVRCRNAAAPPAGDCGVEYLGVIGRVGRSASTEPQIGAHSAMTARIGCPCVSLNVLPIPWAGFDGYPTGAIFWATGYLSQSSARAPARTHSILPPRSAYVVSCRLRVLRHEELPNVPMQVTHSPENCIWL
ncbi:hypothetical protein BV25DRAFT_1597845 [Artomyces pyxidatus]|uniref:Uncharacterized protein n=1 Tax=Artomyces pyxidatus TaxID=48021 RepID=A0ACB8TC92_9AGAM|nr:hypothetical protein BV25DRAFT_1597845 [Artomyces pyxidatus]